MVDGHFPTAVEELALRGEGECDDMCGVVIVVAALPRQAEHGVEWKVREMTIESVMSAGELLHQPTVGNFRRRSEKGDSIGRHAEVRQRAETLRVAEFGRAAVGEIDAVHLRAGAQRL